MTKELGYEISDTPGIKAHICTLMPKDENGKYVHTYKKNGKDTPAEVYVHSKVTIMDDVFTVISSANLNTRSMQVDTELGIIMECAEVAEGLRKRLWDYIPIRTLPLILMICMIMRWRKMHLMNGRI